EEDQKKILKSLITEATAEGEKQSKIEIAKNMLDMGIEKETIVKATGLTEEEISKMKEASN
ncbi:TPA: transposase, partial [Candidatus Ventrenecus avicola]|nr:transposase [Candidatus Ventrenecus avicola]